MDMRSDLKHHWKFALIYCILYVAVKLCLTFYYKVIELVVYQKLLKIVHSKTGSTNIDIYGSIISYVGKTKIVVFLKNIPFLSSVVFSFVDFITTLDVLLSLAFVVLVLSVFFHLLKKKFVIAKLTTHDYLLFIVPLFLICVILIVVGILAVIWGLVYMINRSYGFDTFLKALLRLTHHVPRFMAFANIALYIAILIVATMFMTAVFVLNKPKASKLDIISYSATMFNVMLVATILGGYLLGPKSL